ncbi:alpha/beta-hydrolase [Auricularia subglabra TFB-10046 SS5]|nr:alpha/beta-hydrolase [Auricularia subglabra TFB-10046 SS5]
MLCVMIRLTSSVRDHTRNAKRGLFKHLVVTPSAVHSSFSESSPDVLLSTTSTGKLVAYLRESETGGSKKRFVEVWSGSKLVASKEVTKVHGEFYTDDFFSSLSFSPSETALVYTAEANPPASPDADKFRYIPSLGERLQNKRRPTLFVLRWTGNSDATISKLRPSLNPPDSVLFGQALFSADETLIARGYEPTADGRRLGITGCTNRPCAIWKLDPPRSTLHGSFDHTGQAYVAATQGRQRKDADDATLVVDCTRLSAPTSSARSPRFLVGESKVVWLANQVGGPHAGCSSLHSLDPVTGAHKEVIAVVDKPKTDGAFPGLFADYIAPRPFLGSSMAIHGVWGSRRTVMLIALSGPDVGAVKELTPRDSDTDVRSWTLLATDGHKRLLCARSSPVTAAELVLGTLEDAGAVSWRVLEQTGDVPALKDLTASIIRVAEYHPLEVIVVRRKDKKTAPCITTPHGGPHFIFTTEFSPHWAALAAEGYVVSLVNYTGSLGHGQHFIEKLLGRAGELDVEECMASTQHLIKLGLTEPGPGKQFIIGGSHGGFLGAHLVGRYPDFFSAVSLRNPVVAAGDMVSVSDIPDWCFAQFANVASAAGAGHIATPDQYASMQAASPMAHVANIKAPVLLLVGDADARVPMTQAKSLYHALKARNGEVDVDMFLFPGAGHALDGVEADRVSYELTKEWFAKVVKM